MSHRILVVGGGAGGLELASRLGRTLGKSGKAEITLIDSRLTHVWKPLLPGRDLGYDTLVIAAGSVTNDFGTPHVAEHCVFLDTPSQAERFHRELLGHCTESMHH